MSKWTHITACLSVDTNIAENRLELKRRVKEFLKDAPKITGSEHNAEVFANILSGYNFSTGRDCEHCEFGPSVIDLEGKNFSCDGPDDYICPIGKYQTCIVISVQGDLRDRTRKQTQKEFKEFLKYINTKYVVRDYSVNIEY